MTRIMTESRGERIIRERAEAKQVWAARWNGWRIFAVDVVPSEDGLSRVNVFCDPATGPSASGMFNFSFLIDADGRGSKRLEALLVACGLTGSVDPAAIEGRYFAARDTGRTPEDFGPLSMALKAA
jgi:hypothetical protein